MQGMRPHQLGFRPSILAIPSRSTLRAAQRTIRGIRASATTTDLPASLKNIVGSFQAVPDPMARYKQLLFFATKLEPLSAEDHTPENKVKGCVSQVWVVPTLKEDGKIYWRADSDSQLTKGLAALLVQGLSGCTPEEIVRLQPDFIAALGLQQSLTPSRNNGFLNMFKLMQAKALELYMAQQKGGTGNGASSGASAAPEASAAAAPAADAASRSSSAVADSMRAKLEAELEPVRMELVDESDKHAGHGHYKGNAQYSGETHFFLEVVSAKFEGMTSLKRHRLVYQIIGEHMNNPVHALSLVTKTPAEAGL